MYGNAKDTDIKKLISNVLIGQSYKHCKFCLGEINEFCSLADEVQLDPQQGGEPITMAEILTSIFGSTDESIDCMCKSCANSAVEAFRFMEMCRSSEKQLHNIYNALTDSLNPKYNDYHNTKVLYLVLENDGTKMIIDGTKRVRSTSEAQKRLKALFRQKVKPNLKRKRFQCRHCGLQFTSKSKLRTHRENNHDNLLYCDQCEKSFTGKVKLRMHIWRWHSKKNIQCPHCPKLFGSKNILNEHNKFAHDRRCVCQLCGKWYGSLKSLRTHERGHDQKTCEVCKKTYKHRKSYIQHIGRCKEGLLERTRPKKYQADIFTCDVCDKSYNRKFSLTTHILLEHSNREVYVCNWCGKKFVHESGLTEHIVTHTGERKHQCPICERHFVTRATLKIHIRRHTGEKPYRCAECGENFCSASSRLDHYKRRHAGPALECQICGSKFRNPYCLREHTQKHFDPKSRLYSSLLVVEQNET